jgi:hypothetical protein
MLSGTPVAPPHPGEPELWERVFRDYWFWADRFGWTPEQVDAQPVIVLDRLREVTVVVEEWRREQAERDG